MCLLILEITMFISGLLALITGKLPPSLFKLLFGKGEYQADSNTARLFGLLLMSPFPLAILFGVLFGPERAAYATGFEVLIVLVVALIAARMVRRFRQPAATL
jgi:hypothetical protein